MFYTIDKINPIFMFLKVFTFITNIFWIFSEIQFDFFQDTYQRIFTCTFSSSSTLIRNVSFFEFEDFVKLKNMN